VAMGEETGVGPAAVKAVGSAETTAGWEAEKGEATAAGLVVAKEEVMEAGWVTGPVVATEEGREVGWEAATVEGLEED